VIDKKRTKTENTAKRRNLKDVIQGDYIPVWYHFTIAREKYDFNNSNYKKRISPFTKISGESKEANI